MTGLGTLLQEARLERGLTIEEIAEQTKIRTQFLVAIEEGRLEDLPDRAYVRAFLRTYARALGVEPASIMLEYEARYVPSPDDDILTIRQRRLEARAKKRTRFLITLLVILGVGLLTYFLYKSFVV
ncbi:MAG TPA: helix-turn-helix domain-containing protein [Firmicutes bacterium]|nr:helix-turn-helix domain-containing protein [Bacillota bacterium]